MARHLNLISFNIPYPPDYGGVIDVYYKLKALHAQGVQVHLHTFYHERSPAKELEAWAEKVYYYPQKGPYESLSFKWPVMAKSRRNHFLVENIRKTEWPVLFEGIQTCYHLNVPALQDHRRFVRIHNVEWQYYRDLKKAAGSLTRRIRFSWESKRLRSCESVLKNADMLLPISRNDTHYYASRYGTVQYLPAFHANDEVTGKTGKGDFILYHGNLAVPENEQAAIFILREIAPQLKYPIILAGKDPTTEVRALCDARANVSLVTNPSAGELQGLMQEAHVHLLHTFQDTGIKLKLVNALFQGRFCVGNNEMLNDVALKEICETANSSLEYIHTVRKLMETPFTEEERTRRKAVLSEQLDNRKNAAKLAQWIFGDVG